MWQCREVRGAPCKSNEYVNKRLGQRRTGRALEGPGGGGPGGSKCQRKEGDRLGSVDCNEGLNRTADKLKQKDGRKKMHCRELWRLAAPAFAGPVPACSTAACSRGLPPQLRAACRLAAASLQAQKRVLLARVGAGGSCRVVAAPAAQSTRKRSMYPLCSVKMRMAVLQPEGEGGHGHGE